MRRESLVATILLLLFIMVTPSCKKDKEEDYGNYMSGGPSFTLPSYLPRAEEITLSASGITNPSSGITYTWKAQYFMPDSVEGQTVTMVTPDSIGSFALFLTATHDDFNTMSANKAIVIIDPTDPDSFSGVEEGENFIIDDRDGTKYWYRKYGTLDWFTENLAWRGAGETYDASPILNSIFGSLYSWEEATGGVGSTTGVEGGPQGVCPAGWRLPTDQDWEELVTAVNGEHLPFADKWSGVGEKLSIEVTINGKALWRYSPENLKLNEVGWNALPTGSSVNSFKSFGNLGQFGFWWSATEESVEEGRYRYIHFNSGDFPYNYGNKKAFAASVRCVRAAQ